MKKNGFSVNTENERIAETTAAAPIVEEAVKSVVTVLFDNGKDYPYYNDKFNLKVGDRVFVDGKLAGKIGTVIKVTTKFKVSTKYYKMVLEKLNPEFHGTFKKAENFMLSKGINIIPFEQMKAWLKAPVIVFDNDDESEEEFYIGEGYECSLINIPESEDVEIEEYQNAFDELLSDNIKAITVNNGIGQAIVKSNHTHIVDFKMEGDKITDIYCECMTPEFCRHALAVCIAIKTFIDEKHISNEDSFTALNTELFNFMVNLANGEVTI